MPARRRALWLTNLAAPYRLPVWEELGKHFALRVGLMESSERLTKDVASNRGSDWAATLVPGVKIVEYRTAVAARGEARYYLATDPRLARDVARSEVLLFGGWESPAYWQALAVAKASGKACVGFYESTLDSQGHSGGPIARARARWFRLMDRVVVPGVAAQRAIEAMGVDPARIVTGFNAVDVEAFHRAAQQAPARDHAGHHFVFVGQFIDRKCPVELIDAFEQVADADDHLTFIGHGQLKEALAERASRDPQRISVGDYLPYGQLPGELVRHDTLVMPSREEVWGLVANEALAAGLQVVVSRQSGVAPSIEAMPGVFVTEVDELAEALRAAREQFRGRIAEPQILQHTPQAFAHVFARALDEAVQTRGGRR